MAMKSFLCSHCGKQFQSERKLKIHAKYHQETEEAEECTTCGKHFQSKVKLNDGPDSAKKVT